MMVYDVTVPAFSESNRVEFTVETEKSVITFLCEWWDNLWHCTTTVNNEYKRSCVLYPNILYYTQDKLYSFRTVTTKNTIGYEDLTGLELLVGINDA